MSPIHYLRVLPRLILIVLSLHAVAGAAFSSTRPVISNFFPAGGAPGTSVTIDGSNFVNVREVRFGNGLAIFTLVSSERLIATVPIDATTGPISITTASGSAVTLNHFTVAPRIIDFSPSNGLAGNLVTVEGANFVGTTAVTFNDRSASSFSVVAATQIHAVVPAGASSGPIRVIAPGGTAVSSRNFVITGTEPFISDFAPINGAPGTVVTIEGRNFTGASAIKFNGTNAASFSVVAPTQIRATVPSGASTGPISVSTASGTGSSTRSFIVTSTPLIAGFTPATGVPGTRVVIDGLNFTGTTAVKFNGTNAASFSVTSPTQISAVVPSGATTGPISVSAPAGTGMSAQNFQVRSDPIIADFAPASGSPGTSVTINGLNFAGITAVKFGTNVAQFSIVATTQINATVPAGAVTAPISIVSTNGIGTSISSFVVTAALPVIASFWPAAGLPGATVIIEGANFSGATAVRFNGTNASFTVTASTQITCTVPAEATSGLISVTTPAGTGFSTARFIAAPRITGFTPASGIAGSSVVIRGTNLADTVEVKFNGAFASFANASANEVTATVPLEAASGPISVRTPAGIVGTTNTFIILPSPAVLQIEATMDDRIRVSWPAAATGFVLQVTETLFPPQWIVVTNVPVVSGFRKSVVIAPMSGNRFYRLSRP